LAKDPTVRVEVFDPQGRVELRPPDGEEPAWRAALPRLAIPLGLASGRPEVGISLLARQFQELAGKGLGAGVIIEVFALSVPLTIAVAVSVSTIDGF
jgi:hypothetical protein